MTQPLDPEAERDRAAAQAPPKRQMSAKIALASCVVVVVLGCFGFWWVVLRDTSPPPVNTPIVADSDIPADAIVPPSPEGVWTVHQGKDTFAGYRINETFAGETFTKTAVGRTPLVSGSLTIAGSTLSAAEIVADLTGLTSAASDRDATQQTGGLEIARFPTATFKLTQPMPLGSSPVQGQPITGTATGELTLHGVTRAVQLELKGTWDGATISVSGTAPIVLADYGIDSPHNDLVGVQDHGEFEVSLVFLWDGSATTATTATSTP